MPPKKLIMPPDMDNMTSEKFRMLPIMIMMTPFFVVFKSDLGMKALELLIDRFILWKRLFEMGKVG